jgi:hypothetical protein
MLHFNVIGNRLRVESSRADGEDWRLTSEIAGTRSEIVDGEQQLNIPLPLLDIDQQLTRFSASISKDEPLPDRPPAPGSRTSRMRVLRSDHGERSLTLVVEGPAGSQSELGLVRRGPIVPKIERVSASDGEPVSRAATLGAFDVYAFQNPTAPSLLIFNFPPGEGWKTITVTLTW